MARAESFEKFVEQQYTHLLRLAFLATGGSRDEAEELVQTTLTAQLPRWESIDDPRPELRRAILIRYLNGLRLRIRELRVRDVTSAPVPEELWPAVQALPSRARAALVARYWLDLPEAEVAHLLVWSSAALQSWTEQGLAPVRAILATRRQLAGDDGEPELTEVEAFLVGELGRVVEPVTPRPDPAARAIRRHRTGRRRTSLVAAGLAVAVAAGVTAGVLARDGQQGTDPAAAPTTARSFATFGGRVGWADKLATGEPRGALGADEGFVAAVTDQVRTLVQDNQSGSPHLRSASSFPDPEQEVRLVFADEIAGQRIVVLSLRRRLVQRFVSTTGEHGQLGRTRLVWLAGPRGASAETLLSALSAHPQPGALAGSVFAQPISFVTITRQPREWADGASGSYDPFRCEPGQPCTVIALAPPECAFTSLTAWDPTSERTEPTGSYAVRTATTFRLEHWLVTCGGVLRLSQRGPAPSDFSTAWQESFTPDLSEALAQASGVTEVERASADVRALAGVCLNELVQQSNQQLAARPRVLWTSRTPGFTLLFNDRRGPDPRGMVAVAPAVDGSWFVAICGDTGATGERDSLRMLVIRMARKPADPFAITVDDWDDSERRVLVLTPPGAASVVLTDMAEDRYLETFVVTNDYASGPSYMLYEWPTRATVLDVRGSVISTVDVSSGVLNTGTEWLYASWFEDWECDSAGRACQPN